MQQIPSSMDDENVLLARRQVLLSGPIEDQITNRTMAKLLYLNKIDQRASISLFIDSPGGHIKDALALFDTIDRYISAPVHTFAVHQAQGLAIWVLAAGEPGRRFVMQDTRLSIEKTRIASTHPDGASYLIQCNSALTKLLLEKTKLSERQARLAVTNGRSFTPAEAISAGIADAIYESRS